MSEIADKAREIALRQLSMVDRTRHQLIEAMTKREIPADVAEQVADRFEEVGLINDEDFAGRLVRSRMVERPTSRRALSMEMGRKGFDREVIDNALLEVSDEDEEAAARELAAKKARATAGLDPQVRRRRIYGALGRKGFSPDLCRKVTGEVLDTDPYDL